MSHTIVYALLAIHATFAYRASPDSHSPLKTATGDMVLMIDSRPYRTAVIGVDE